MLITQHGSEDKYFNQRVCNVWSWYTTSETLVSSLENESYCKFPHPHCGLGASYEKLLFRHKIVSHSLQSQGQEHARLLCPPFHSLLEFAQICVHWAVDTVKPSQHPLPTSPFALNYLVQEIDIKYFKTEKSWII